MKLWRKLKTAYLRFRNLVRMWTEIYRQVVRIWKMLKGSQPPVVQRSQTQATSQKGRTIEVDVIPPRR